MTTLIARLGTLNRCTHANEYAPEDGPDESSHCYLVLSIQKPRRAAKNKKSSLLHDGSPFLNL